MNNDTRIGVKGRLPKPNQPSRRDGRGVYDINMSVSATASTVTLRVTVDYAFPSPQTDNRRVQQLMVWIDGRRVTESFWYQMSPPYGGHGWVETWSHNNTRQSWTITVSRAISPVEPGNAVVYVSLWDGYNAFIHGITQYPSVPGVTTAPALPSVVNAGIVVAPVNTRSMFTLSREQILQDGVLLDIADAGINTLAVSIFNNPRTQPINTFNQWLAYWSSLSKVNIDYAVAQGFYVLGIGDDFIRDTQASTWMDTCQYAEQAVAHVSAYLRDTGVCVGVDVQDEQGALVPEDTPGIGPLMAGWRSVSDWPGFAWPAPGLYTQRPLEWESPDYSDYSSRFWTCLEWRNGRVGEANLPYGQDSGQLLAGFQRAADQVPDWPWICLVSTTGPFYTKRVAGSNYRPNADLLQQDGATAQLIVFQAWLAMAYGASGIRMYAYDYAGWRAQRSSNPIGSTDLQTGSRPGDTRWSGVRAACRSMEAREDDLLSETVYTPVVAYPWVVGRRGDLTFVINCANRELACPFGSVTRIMPAGESVGVTLPAYGVGILPL